MKIRNGFISNSSSASFILAFPKDKPVELKDVESYFGGFNKELSLETRGAFTFEVWKSQYFDSDGWRKEENRYLFRDEEGKPLSTQYIRYTCTADKKYIEENRDLICNKDFSEDVLYNDMISPTCKECKYLKKEKRTQRDDDYYYVLDSTWCEELKEWLKKHQDSRIIELEIDDNDPPRSLPYGIASEITSNADSIFISSDHAFVSGGK